MVTREGAEGIRARLLAFYLPQFHPIPENHAWWGKGFTEWTNVAKARPLFPGHYQPHIPTDLGFYDLRLSETRIAQAELVRKYGIEGFCYWHYWFKGKRLLGRQLDDVLASGEPRFPFCLAWVNESWSRRWLGEERSVLQRQEYSAEDDLDHIRWLMGVMADPRYIRVAGRPLFLVYRPRDLPDPRRTTDCWRWEMTRASWPEPYLLGIDGRSRGWDTRQAGFDGTVQFTPQLGALPYWRHGRLQRLARRSARALGVGPVGYRLRVYDYEEWYPNMAMRYAFSYYPSVFPRWDNSPRLGREGIVFVNSPPPAFGKWLKRAIDDVGQRPPEFRLIFINAWNEWAEGNHLEPDLEFGDGYLRAVHNAVTEP